MNVKYKEDINCVFQGIDGKGKIYISNILTAKQQPLLKKLNIANVITLTKQPAPKYNRQIIPNHLILPINDQLSQSIAKYFNKTYEFIESCRKYQNVLVHCYAGMSLSPTIVIAYLMKKYAYQFDIVLAMIKRKRNQININYDIQEQLRKYEKDLEGLSRLKSLSIIKNKSKNNSLNKNKQNPQKSIFKQRQLLLVSDSTKKQKNISNQYIQKIMKNVRDPLKKMQHKIVDKALISQI